MAAWRSATGCTRHSLAAESRRRPPAALTDAALALPAVDHVEIHHDMLNLASERVPAKLGFTQVGTTTGRFELAPGDSGTTAIWRIAR